MHTTIWDSTMYKKTIAMSGATFGMNCANMLDGVTHMTILSVLTHEIVYIGTGILLKPQNVIILCLQYKKTTKPT